MGINSLCVRAIAVLSLGVGVAGAQQPANVEEVVVSASRITREGFTAPTPTTEFGQDEIQARAAVSVASVLFELPSVRPSATAVQGSASSGFTTANLRGLNAANATRTLVLVDGGRVVSSNPQGQVDLNTIPAALVDRVEVVTGGASAAWGSDAVAGVTNFILKKKVNGFIGSVQYGQSQRSDNKEQGFNLAWGSDFAADRGQFMIAGEYSKLYDVATFDDRDIGRAQYGVNQPAAGALRINGVAYTRAVQAGLVRSSQTFGGVIVAANGGPLLTTNAGTGVQTPNSPLSGIQFGSGSTVLPFTYGSNVGSQFMVGGSGVYAYEDTPLATPTRRVAAYARTTYELAPETQLFLDLSHADTSSNVSPVYNNSPNQDPVLNISRNNAFVQTQPGLAPLRTILDANPGIASFNVGRINGELGRFIYDTSTKTDRITAGFDSLFAETWKLRGYATYGRTDYALQIRNLINEANLRSSIDAVSIGGQIVCNPATIAAQQAEAGCVPANIFGAGSISAAAADYILGTEFLDIDYDQTAAGVSIEGEPFSTWAGKVSTALGVEYRREKVDANSDPTSQKSTTAFPAGGWQFGNPKPYQGSYDVKELFAETVVPLLADKPLVKSFDFNGAVRSTDYSTSGRVTSSKLGLTWRPVEQLLLRAATSKDNRAPNLFELYSVGVVRNAQITGSPNAFAITNGSPTLTPEKGDTQTYGITWTPSFVPGLSASVDLYRIKISNAIQNLTPQVILNACLGAQGVPQNTALCPLITRDAQGNITQVSDPILNTAAGIKTNGIDLEMSYRSQLASLFGSLPGQITLRALGTRVSNYRISNGTTTSNVAGDVTGPGGTPRWRFSTTQDYQNGNFGFYLQENYTGAARINNSYNVTNTTDIFDNHIPSFLLVNASARYALRARDQSSTTVFVSVNNLFDRDPPINPATSGPIPFYNNSQFYDSIGRVYKAGVRFTF